MSFFFFFWSLVEAREGREGGGEELREIERGREGGRPSSRAWLFSFFLSLEEAPTEHGQLIFPALPNHPSHIYSNQRHPNAQTDDVCSLLPSRRADLPLFFFIPPTSSQPSPPHSSQPASPSPSPSQIHLSLPPPQQPIHLPVPSPSTTPSHPPPPPPPPKPNLHLAPAPQPSQPTFISAQTVKLRS